MSPRPASIRRPRERSCGCSSRSSRKEVWPLWSAFTTSRWRGGLLVGSSGSGPERSSTTVPPKGSSPRCSRRFMARRTGAMRSDPRRHRRAFCVLAALAALAYLGVAVSSLHVDFARIREGVPRGATFAAAMLRPDFVTRWLDVRDGLLESLAITVLATAAGALVALPLGVGAARNLAPVPIYLGCRAILVASRALQEVVLAIFFVVLFGLGPLAGVLTLAVGSIGFLAKLLAEAIEAIDPAPLDAIRSTGASWAQGVAFGVVPQVAPRMVGLVAYRLDINFRE